MEAAIEEQWHGGTKLRVTFGHGLTNRKGRPLGITMQDFARPAEIVVALAKTRSTQKSIHEILGYRDIDWLLAVERKSSVVERHNRYSVAFPESSVEEEGRDARLNRIRNDLHQHAADLQDCFVSLVMSPRCLVLFDALFGDCDDSVPVYRSIRRMSLSVRYCSGHDPLPLKFNRHALRSFQALDIEQTESMQDSVGQRLGSNTNWATAIIQHIQQLVREGNFHRLILPLSLLRNEGVDNGCCQELLGEIVSRVPTLQMASYGWDAIVALGNFFPTDQVQSGRLQELELRGSLLKPTNLSGRTIVDALSTIVNCSPRLEELRLRDWRPEYLGDLGKIRRLKAQVGFQPEDGVESVIGRLMESQALQELDIKTYPICGQDTAIPCLEELLAAVTRAVRTTNLRCFRWEISYSSGDGRLKDNQLPFLLPVARFLDALRQNQSLFMTDLCGIFWSPSTKDAAKYLSTRNSCKTRVLVPYSNNEFPNGLWPRLLEFASSDLSIVYLLLRSNASLLKRYDACTEVP